MCVKGRAARNAIQTQRFSDLKLEQIQKIGIYSYLFINPRLFRSLTVHWLHRAIIAANKITNFDNYAEHQLK